MCPNTGRASPQVADADVSLWVLTQTGVSQLTDVEVDVPTPLPPRVHISTEVPGPGSRFSLTGGKVDVHREVSQTTKPFCLTLILAQEGEEDVSRDHFRHSGVATPLQCDG